MGRSLPLLLLLGLATRARATMVVVGYQIAGNTLTSIYDLRTDGTLLYLSDVELGTSATWMTWNAAQSTLYAGVATGVVSAALNVTARTISAPQGLCALAAGATANTPVHIALHPDGTSVLSASYFDGTLSVCPLAPNGIVAAAPSSQFFLGPNAHEVVFGPTPLNATTPTFSPFFVVPTLGDDSVVYGVAGPGAGNVSVRTDAQALSFPGAATLLPPGPARAGAMGPRHVKFHPNNQWAYVLHELNNTVARMDYHATTGLRANPSFVSCLRRDFVLPGGLPDVTLAANGWPQQASELQLHPNGHFLYVSNRGTASLTVVRGYAPPTADNSIAVFAINTADGSLSLVYNEDGGLALHFPRHFALTPDGAFMVVANQRGDSLTTFAVEGGGVTLRKIQTVGGGCVSSNI